MKSHRSRLALNKKTTPWLGDGSMNSVKITGINACGNLRQKLSISYVLYDDVQPILYVRF